MIAVMGLINRAHRHRSGTTDRGYSHAVIYFDGKLVFDPYPNGEGIDLKHIYIFIPIEINNQQREPAP